MALDDIISKAKDALGGGKADGAIDKAAEFIKDKTPDNIDGHVDTAAEKAKDFLDKP
ncbi:antitoxin [Serinibacter arcticus]|uniref:Antitoxin n=1 Tax=Serinibacter arcticus TaxID=1655435 RepID=A0A2U1ZWM5_9MICO|nr:antitoxin [Serinibacter arcticus]PWD51385.1 antitoxin [Serinibacter arcticus]